MARSLGSRKELAEARPSTISGSSAGTVSGGDPALQDAVRAYCLAITRFLILLYVAVGTIFFVTSSFFPL